MNSFSTVVAKSQFWIEYAERKFAVVGLLHWAGLVVVAPAHRGV